MCKRPGEEDDPNRDANRRRELRLENEMLRRASRDIDLELEQAQQETRRLQRILDEREKEVCILRQRIAARRVKRLQ